MFKTQSLYGGAISCVMPEGFLDASILREVPDTQEVFVNSREAGEKDKFKDGLGLDESVIVDLLQRVDAENDRDALSVHLQEITGLNGSSDWTVVQIDTVTQPTPYQTCIALETAYKWDKEDHAETLVLCAALIRLEDVQTDVILSVNLPVSQDQTLQQLRQWAQGPSLIAAPPQVQAAYTLLQAMATNFKVVDNSLFV
ncbi:LANO_0E16512g1_1 [Lachancea nothofagi CBS 11611]|uniref:LANO_0E16512g1_1 n=1 Tax=Lachancea nothofagi CBS 11611 TaxID=1266666 RepID=A0A1G4K228_9SACH|nr:LANO_0E16512g1_1 [Lachancea nothofagi CBS 11611]